MNHNQKNQTDREVSIVEVGPRDGLQNEKMQISTADKIEFIERLSQAGLKEIEIGSFVSPKWVPQMEGTEAIAHNFKNRSDALYTVLVPNEKGMEMALRSGVKKIAIFTAASESFNQKNINCGIEESFARFAPLLKLAQSQNISVRGYISTAFVCPYEGDIAVEQAARMIRRLADLGIQDISIGDTIGCALPHHVSSLLAEVLKHVPSKHLALHFHDTYGCGLVNVAEALRMGIRRFDASAGGLGGCPYAPGASGNLATNDLVWYLEGEGWATGVDLNLLDHACDFIQNKLGRNLPSRVYHARP